MHTTRNFTLRLLPEERDALEAAATAKKLKPAELARRILRRSLGLPVAGAVRPYSHRPPREAEGSGQDSAPPD
jgi:hypothetical protein